MNILFGILGVVQTIVDSTPIISVIDNALGIFWPINPLMDILTFFFRG